MWWPRRPTRAQLRRELAEDERDRQRHERPNEPPPRVSPYTNCHDSVYLTHRFVADGHGGRRCVFCRRPEPQCLRRRTDGGA